jgi:DNA polymerase V
MQTNKGGKREGSGRKGYKEPTKTVRVPVSLIPEVKTMLADILEFRNTTHPDMRIPALNPAAAKRPLFASNVPAGFPSPADDYIECELDLNEFFIPHPSSTFFVRAVGDSMNRAGIFDNTILSVDRSLDADHGSIVIAVVNNEMTVKRLHKKGREIALLPESDNPEHQPITFKNGDDLIVWGVVNAVMQKLK